jgi:hypothetical protein
MAKTLTTLSYYIDGTLVQSKSENVRPVYDPGSGEEIALHMHRGGNGRREALRQCVVENMHRGGQGPARGGRALPPLEGQNW